jgi:DNA-binding Lrp family transcriptional regulator
MDEIDKKIIVQLQADGRTTLNELAKIIGYTSMGTKKRLEKLIKNGTIKISALLNVNALGLHPAIVMLEMENAEAMQNLLERFKDCPRVLQIFKAVGGFNLIALVIAEDQDTLESISMEKCSMRSGPGIRRSEFYPISDTYFTSYLQIRESLAHKRTAVAPCSVDCDPCIRYELQKCVGCPATSKYKGTL